MQTAIAAFVGPMDRFIRDNSDHKARVDAGMLSEGSAKAFRSALSANTELQAAAVDPYTGVIDIWTAYIWRYLLQTIFSEAGTLDFYSNAGQNASYYIKNVNEMEYLMTLANPPVFGRYKVLLWINTSRDRPADPMKRALFQAHVEETSPVLHLQKS